MSTEPLEPYYTGHVEHGGPESVQHPLANVLSEIRDALRALMPAEIERLRAALRLVDEDARHHLRSDEIAPCLLRPHALRAVRDALK